MSLCLPSLRRLGPAVLLCVLAVALSACTGRGGGHLAPGAGFTGPANLGFSFACEDPGGPNPPTGQLRIQLAYDDKGTSPLTSSRIAVHGTVDDIDPVVESMICIGQEPPPTQELIFLGRFRPTASPAGFPETCRARETSGAALCRFEVIVRDNDGDLAPSPGDFFSIRLSTTTDVTSDLDPATVFYARAGLLEGGNITVK